MARRFREEISEWSKGALTDIPSTKIPKSASPRAYNTAWLKGGFPSQRKGLQLLTQASGFVSTVAFVQSKSKRQLGGSTAITFDSDNIAGNLLAIAIYWNGSGITVSTISDSQGNTYTAEPTGQVDMATNKHGRMYYVENIAAGANTITVAFAGGSPIPSELIAFEISGVETSDALDVSALAAQVNPGTGTDAVTSGAVTPTLDGAYCFGVTDDMPADSTITEGTGWTSREYTTVQEPHGEELIQTTAASVAATFTTDSASSDFITGIMCFKAAVVHTGGEVQALGRYKSLDWTIQSNGTWFKIVDGVFEPIDSSQVAPFSEFALPPSTAIANNLLFAVNGSEKLKTDGTTIMPFGITAPVAPASAIGASGNPSGTYRIALTSLNEDTGAESSLGAFTQKVVTGQKLDISWVFPVDAQVSHVRAHIFKEGLSDEFFRLGSTNVTPAPDSVTGGYDSGTTSITIDVTDANINDLIILSPSIQENDPPPEGTKFILHHGSRMFATDGQKLFYSKIDKPESFDPDNFEPVNTNDDQEIVAFGTVADEHLLILKTRSLHILLGPDDPNTWEVKEIDPTIGLQAHRLLIEVNGALWWKSDQGIYRFVFGERPERMDALRIGNRTESLNQSTMSGGVGAYDSVRQRLVFGMPESGQTRNTVLFPYNDRLKLWEDRWDPMDISAMGTLFDPSTGEPYIAIGNYKGRVFRLWTTPYVDGVRLGNGTDTTFTLKGTLTSSTDTTITDTGATFDTDGDGLAEIVIQVVNQDGEWRRNIIDSNTGTVLTLRNPMTLDSGDTWTYYIGCPNWEFDTKSMAPTSAPVEEGSLFNTRKFKRLLIKGMSAVTSTTVTVNAIIDNVENPFARVMTAVWTASGAVWDVDLFGTGVFGEENKIITVHKAIGKKGKVIGFRLVNREPNEAIILLGLGVQGTEFTYKS